MTPGHERRIGNLFQRFGVRSRLDTDTSDEGDANKSNQFAGNHGVPCAGRSYLTIRGLEEARVGVRGLPGATA